MQERHGEIKSKTYSSWQSMKNRCLNPNNTVRSKYRQIKICGRWINSYVEFKNDMGERPLGCSLDRIDNNGDYEPGNCRWATNRIQGNNKSNNRRILAFGESLTISQWAERTGLKKSTIQKRLSVYNCTPEEALNPDVTNPFDGDRNHFVTAFGRRMKVADWARESGIHKSTILKRIIMWKWSPELAVSKKP